MELLDFTKTNFIDLKEDLIAFIKDAGAENWGQKYRGISDLAINSIDNLLAGITQNDAKIKSPAALERYFKQVYIMRAFIIKQGEIKWHPEISPPPSKTYFIDFTQFWDLKEIEFELKDFIKMVGKLAFPEGYHLSEPVVLSISSLLDGNLYGRKCGGYMVKCPRDLHQFFTQKYIRSGFDTYKDQIKWMRDTPGHHLAKDEHAALSCLEDDIPVDFTLTDVHVIKLQLDCFLMQVGRSMVHDNYVLSKTLQKQIDRLLNRRFYGQTREHNITKPEDLDLFFTQKFVQRGFRQNQGKIRWAKHINDPPKRTYRRFFERPLIRPPLRRVPVFKNPMVTSSSWLKDAKERKEMIQEELYWQAVNIPCLTRSPLELMPVVYAQKESTPGNSPTWWCAKLSNNINQMFTSISKISQLPSWLNNAWPNITFNGFDMGHETFFNYRTHSVFSNEDFLTAPFTVYCLIVHVVDFERWHMWQCNCKCLDECARGPCPFQVYVGKASRGLLDRWVDQRYAHTRVAKRLTNFMHELRDQQGRPFKMYEPGKESNAQLPQCMLGMAKASFYPSAVFVLKSCNNEKHMEDFEKKVITALKATDMRKGLNALK